MSCLLLLLISINGTRIHDVLQDEMQIRNSHHVLIHGNFEDWNQILVATKDSTKHLPRLKRFETMKKRLIQYTSRLHDQILISDDLNANSLWFINAIVVRNASNQMIRRLAKHPDVHLIHSNIELKRGLKEEIGNPWGLRKIRANRVHSELKIKGQGIVIGILDKTTTMDPHVFHYPLVNNLRNATATATNQHGNFVSSVAAAKGFGVAPEAAIVACNIDTGTLIDMLECAATFICPNDQCQHTPSVINHSYGVEWDKEAIRAVRLMIDTFHLFNIINVATTHNINLNKVKAASVCTSDENTVRFPGNFQDVIAVGAINSNNHLASFSAQGQKTLRTYGYIKPNFVAPGVNIRASSLFFSSKRRSGVSFATPMVTGTIALMLSAVKDLNHVSFDIILDVLQRTAVKHELNAPELDCSSDFRVFPNSVYGHGLIDAYAAVKLMIVLDNQTRIEKKAFERSELEKQRLEHQFRVNGASDLAKAVAKHQDRVDEIEKAGPGLLLQQKYKDVLP